MNFRAHEEEWEVNDYGGIHVWVNGEPGNSTHVAVFNDEVRARLAAQAPAMARLLLAIFECEPTRNEVESFGIEGLEKVLRDAGIMGSNRVSV